MAERFAQFSLQKTMGCGSLRERSRSPEFRTVELYLDMNLP